MSQSKHTPGPWSFLIDPKTREGRIYGADGFMIHDLFNGTAEALPMVEANAALMASSPELLAAAKEAMSALDSISPGDHRKMHALQLLRTAITKAEGRES